MVIERFNMTKLERVKYDLEVLMNNYTKDNELYTEEQIIWIRFGLTKALKTINKYIKEND